MSGKPAARLGKGLSALLGDASTRVAPGAATSAEAGGAAVLLALESLEPGPFQPRGPIDEAALGELAASIRRAGVLQPLLARPHPTMPGRYQIIAGERRWRASRMAGLSEIPVVVQALSDPDAMAASLIENLQREDLNPVEEARGYRRLIEEFGLTHQALGEALGRSRAHLSNMLRLLALPPAVQEDLAAGRLSVGHAKAVLAAPDPAALAAEVMSKGLSVRQAEARAAAGQRGQEGASASRQAGYMDDPDVRAMVDDLVARLGLPVRIIGSGGRGQVVIEFSDLAQLDGIVGLLMVREG
jgi:ParB family chromosome partitioning protein